MLLRAALPVLCAALIGSCVIGERDNRPVPQDSATAEVALAPGESQSFEFLVEAETFDSGETFRIRMSPSVAALTEQNVMVEQSWTRGDNTEDGWPDSVDLDADEDLQGVLSVSVTNTDEADVAEFELRVEVDAGGQVPEPSTEDLRLEIRLR